MHVGNFVIFRSCIDSFLASSPRTLHPHYIVILILTELHWAGMSFFTFLVNEELGDKHMVPGCCSVENLEQAGDIGGELLALEVVVLLEIVQNVCVLGGHKVDGNSLTTVSSRATNTMEVVLAVPGEVIVDDQGNVMHCWNI